MADLVLTLLSGLGLLALGGGFLGRLHPAGDSLAVFRAPLALAGMGWFAAGWGVGALPLWPALPCLAAWLTVIGHRLQRGAVREVPVVHYQKNMSFRMSAVTDLAADIRAVGPDILTLQEVTPANSALLESVADLLPYQHHCAFEAVGAVALASRWPILEDTRHCPAHGMAAARVAAPDGPLWVVSVHLHWPWPARPSQAAQHARILAALRELDGPVLLGGDFNMVRWSALVRCTAQAIDARPGGRARASFRLKGILPLAIDQSLIPREARGRSEARPLAGSDHRGLVVRF